jgi:hypothetical protein
LSDSGSSRDTLEKLEKLEDQIAELVSLNKSHEVRIRELESGGEGGSEGGGGQTWDVDLTDQETRVMNYIAANPNATKQDVVDHLKGVMARVPVFNTIDSLVRYGIIEDNPDSKNRQVHRLSLNNDSIFFSVLQELAQFEESFRNLVRKIKQKGEEIYASKPDHPKDEYFEVMTQAHLVFDDMLRSYMIRYVEEWPKKFHNRRDVSNKLLGIVLSRASKIREHLPEITVENMKYLRDVLLIWKLQGTEHLQSFVTESKKFGLTQEMEPVLDSLWEINKEIQGYAYPEPRLFSWDFQYYKDDWRKLLELTKKHPDQTLSKKKMPIYGLLNKPIDIMLK